MGNRIGLIFGAITAFAMLFYASFSIIQGGLMNLAKATVFIAPFVFMLFLYARPSWHIMIPVFLVAEDLKLPIYGLNKLEPINLLLLSSMAVLILDTSLHARVKKFSWTWIDKFILILALVLTGRLLHDRPGFVALGAESGGLISSLMYVLAVWFYFVVMHIAETARFSRKQLLFTGWCVAAVAVLLVIFKTGQLRVFTRIFGDPVFWMLCAISTSLLATASAYTKRTVLFYLTSFFFLFVGLISNFRSRVFFFFSEILAVSFFTQRLKRSLIILGGGAVLGVVLLLIIGKVPGSMERALSLFTDVDVANSRGALGWSDSFRGQLYQAAWVQIKQNPFLGSGFGLSVEAAIGALMTAGAGTQFELLAMSGSYHNSVVALAVKSGLPAAFLFSAVSIAIPLRFARMLKINSVPGFKVWGMAIIAFWCANTGMMLMNGGPGEYFVCMVLNGYMMGMLRNAAAQPVVAQEDPTGADVGAVESHG